MDVHAASGPATPPRGGTVPADSAALIESTLASLEHELIACQRLAALGSMLGMIVHEYKNLMTPLLARADFALNTGAPDDMRNALERTRAHVERAIIVSERLVNLAYDREWPVESCSVLEAVEEAIAATTRPLEKDGITLTLAVPADLRVPARRDLLIQVMLNLILNARAAMKNVRGPLKITARRDGDHVVIEICDSGTGLLPQQMEGVLKPFLASAEQKGRDWQAVGLGLNVCRVIARKYNATLTARANEGRGCTFSLRWPAAPDSGGADHG